MKSIIKTNIFLVILVTLLSVSGANAAGVGKNIVVLLSGTGNADSSGNQFTQFGLDVPPEFFACFDMDLVDAKTGNVIGSGSDCLSGVNFTETGGAMMTATSFFHFPGGTLVSQGLVTVQPRLHGLEDYTHVTGAAPSPNENNVIYGDRKFRNAAGSVRLSGLVNMENVGSGIIVFDCVFIIDIEKKRHRTR